MREGDIYSWRWRDNDRHADDSPYRSYHCKSRIAVFHNGVLRDTFWFGNEQSSQLRPEEVILTLRGNVNDMTEIRKWDVPYYAPDDIVDMRHSNNQTGPIYLKAGAQRNAVAMMDYATQKLRDAKDKKRSAESEIERRKAEIALIDSGKLDEVHF